MKHVARPVAALLALLAATCLTALPAQAAQRSARPPTVVTYRGYTITWRSSGAAPRVTRTPGRRDHFPAGVTERTLRQTPRRAATDFGRGCTLAPDSFGRANFRPACDAHDRCYSPTSSTDRRQCDRTLLANLTLACASAYAGRADTLARQSCFTVAAIYYVGVRVFGRLRYVGTGNPA